MSTASFRHVMLDLETFGTGPNAAIASIGACRFDLKTGQIGEVFHVKIAFTPSMGTCDPATVKWWLEQTKEAQEALLSGERVSLADALSQFRAFCHNGEDVDGIWSNGPTFDEVILKSAYDRLNSRWPISFRASRCCRTFFMLATDMKLPRTEFKGIKHDACADAVNQAEAMCAVYGALFPRAAGVEL